MPFENSVFLAQPNPDAVYYYSPVDGSGTYRVTGERGNAPVAGFAIGNSIIGTAATPGKGLGNYDIDALQLRPDGTFEVIFSIERPTGYTGNWLHLHPDADFILVRQFCHDWGREVDMRLAIERIDATGAEAGHDTGGNRPQARGAVRRLCAQPVQHLSSSRAAHLR